MARLTLPDPVTGATTLLRDAAGAQAWANAQKQAQPMRMLRAVLAEIEGIDASDLGAAARVDMLDMLRPPIVLAEAGLEIRYANKPLPLVNDEAEAFDIAWRVWHALGVAYLRTTPFLPPADALRPLYRAAIALRESLHCHYIGGQEAPQSIVRLLYEILLTAEALGVARTPLPDPEFKHLGESNIAADVAWSFLLHFCDPYRFSSAQFAVANRALSRWRELAGFQTQPDDNPKARCIPLAPWLGDEELTADGPKFIDVRPVARKLKRRVESLQSGESPDSLRLGRELSASACAALLRMLDKSLRPKAKFVGDGVSTKAVKVDLVFGHEHMYAAVTGTLLEDTEVTAKSDRISHERIALFGHDNMANRADTSKELKIPRETWGAEDGWILRAANAGAQVLAPSLVAIPGDEETPVRLAVLVGLRQTVDGWLMATLRQLPGVPVCGIQRLPANVPVKGLPKTPVFLFPEDKETDQPASICLPTGTGAREGTPLALDRCSIEHLRLTAVIERGANFVRFGYVKT